MIPNIPVPVWEQISVVIVFSFLLAGLGWSGLQAVIRVSQYLSADASAQKQVELVQRCLAERRELWQQIIQHLELIALTDQEMLVKLENLRLGQAQLLQAFETLSASCGSPVRARRAKGSVSYD